MEEEKKDQINNLEEEIGPQPTDIDRFNYGSNLIARALALSKKNEFKAVALSFTDLEFLQQVINAGISAVAQYSNLTSTLMRRDLNLTDNLKTLLHNTDHLYDQLGLVKVGLQSSLNLSQQIVRAREDIEPAPAENLIKIVDEPESPTPETKDSSNEES